MVSKITLFIASHLVLFIFWSGDCLSQTVPLAVEGSIKVGDSNEADPEPGTIRFKDNRFLGWDGLTWVSLGGFKTAGEVIDYDGNSYRTVQIGSQIWMTENLRVAHYNDGSTMQVKIGNIIINFGSPGTLRYPEDNNSNAPIYGGLYDYACVETNKLCPTGWKVPDDSDWQALSDYLGGSETSGNALKELGIDHWAAGNQGCNESGFTARGAGRWHESGNSQSNDFHTWAYYWSATVNNDNPSYWNLTYSTTTTSQNLSPSKDRGCSIRCIKD